MQLGAEKIGPVEGTIYGHLQSKHGTTPILGCRIDGFLNFFDKTTPFLHPSVIL